MPDQQHGEDPRPKPQFGELAPEGWTWTPPEDQDRLDTSRGSERDEPEEDAESTASSASPDRPHPDMSGWGAGPGAHPNPAHYGPAPYAGAPALGGRAVGGAKTAPYWNQPLTLLLLAVGAVGAIITISTLAAIPQSMQIAYTAEKLGTYHAPASLPSIILAGQIVQGLIWAASLATSILLIVRRHLSFYVPLIAGGLAAVVFIVFIVAIISADPNLIDAYRLS